MALEQAQQQFAAAERIGYESRPLNLFYGLSQAGRAIAAGSHMLGQGTPDQWQAKGHGLKFDANVPNGLLPTPIRQEGGTTDLFSRVSISVGSPLDFNAVEFGAAMNQLLDYTTVFQQPEGYPRPLTEVRVFDPHPEAFPLNVEVPVPGLATGQQSSVDDVRALLAAYPALDGLELALDDDGNVRWSPNDGRCFVIVENPDQLDTRSPQDRYKLQGTDYYRRQAVLLPRAGVSKQSLRPLMSWWAVLYALSILARYAPSKWTETLSLTESPLASKIEFLLDSALDAVPELLWSELFRLAANQD